MTSFRSISLLLAASVAAAAPTNDRSCSKAVNTTSGRYSPTVDASHPNVASFLDIPYAENPTGDLRFAPPVAKAYPGDDVQVAKSLPDACFQYTAANFVGIVSEYVTAGEVQYGDYSNTTEDCLRLSIFAPTNAVAKSPSHHHHQKREALPVVIWIHGGGWFIGGTNVPFQLAPSWVDRSQEHIVVQFQYRLNILGLPNAAGLAETGDNLNLVVLDQRMAIEWVRDNIAAFGGDPERMTLWGESAGAYSSDGYIYAYPEDPIVSAVISDSGNAVAMGAVVDPPLAFNHTNFSTAAKSLGCGNLTAADELACMRKVPGDEIKQYIQASAGQGGAVDDNLAFGAIADNVTVFADYQERIQSGDASKFPSHIPLLIGTNANEGAALVPYEFPGSETATELPKDLQTIADAFSTNVNCATLKEVQLRSKVGAKTHQYLYSGNWTNISPRPWLGAYHTAELPMIFGTHDTEGPSTEAEKTVSEKMQDRYLEFIKDPVNGLESHGWPVGDEELEKSAVIEWGADGKVERLISAKDMLAQCANSGYDL